MADKRISVVFDASMDVSKVRGSVSEIQKVLNNLSMPKTMQASTANIFQKLQNELDNYNALTSKTAHSIADVKKADKSLQNIITLFEQVNDIAKQIGTNPINFIDPTELKKIESVQKALEKAKQAMSNTAISSNKASITSDLEKAKKTAEELKKKVGNLSTDINTKKTQRSGIEESLKRAREEAVQLREELAKLQANPVKKETQTQQKDGKRTTTVLNSVEYEEYLKKLNETKNKKNELNRKIGELGKQLKTTDTSQLETEFNDIKDKAEQAAQAVTELENKLKHVGKDTKKEAIEKLRDELADLTGLAKSKIPTTITKIEEFVNSLSEVEKVKVGEALSKIGPELSKIGAEASHASQGMENAQKRAEDLTRSAQEMEHLKNQVLDFFSIGNAVQIFKNAIRDAFDTVKELDAVMTETAVVTDFSIGDMWNKLPEYANKASAMGASIKDLYSATTLYYQQGLNTNEAMGLGVETMKMARVANMEAAAATEAMTAALRGFNMEINSMNAERINDVYSELAAVTAADTSQIATAMSKTASIASSANMEFETTAAFLAQIIETTQEAPETAGTAMKTIIARFTEVKQLFDEGMLSGKDSEGEEININKIDTALKTVGISLKDFLTGTKGIDDIFLELASKWDSLDLATQRYIATTAAGSRQQSRFIAMMSNYDRTMELVNAANNSAGASQEQFNKTLDSLDAKLQRLQNAWAEFTMGLANNQAIKAGVDFLTMLLETINKLTGSTGNEGFGGLVTSFSKLLVLIGALKAGGGFIRGIFSGLGGTADIEIFDKIQKITGITQAFGRVGDAGELLQVTLEGLKGGFGVLGQQASKTGEFLANTVYRIMDIGAQKTGKLGLAAVEAGSNLGVFALGLAKIAIPILTVVAATALLVEGFKAVYAASPQGQLEAARNATQEAGEAADMAAESYNNLKSALDSLAGKEAGLASLTRGTQEWDNAIQEINADVLELIDTYPELSEFLDIGENGKLTLNTKDIRNEKTVKDILEDYSDRSYKARAAEAIAKTHEIAAEKNVDYVGLAGTRSFYKTGSTDKTYSSEEIFNKLAEAVASGELSREIKKDGIQETDQEALNRWLSENYKGYKVLNEKDFTLEAIRAYAQKAPSQERAIDSQYKIAATQAVGMANLQGEAAELISNLDLDILGNALEKTYNEIYSNFGELTDDQKKAYTLANEGYEYKNGKVLDDAGKEVSESQIKQYVAAQMATEEQSIKLEKISESLINKDSELVNKALSEGGQAISKELLEKYATYDGTGYKTDKQLLDQMAVDAGFKDLSDIAEIFGADLDTLVTTLAENFEASGDRLIKARKSIVTNMSKYGAMNQTEAFGYQDEANYLALMEEIVGDSYLPALENLFSSLEMTGDSDLISGALESFKQLGVTKESVAEIDNLISNIDWTNPIEATKTITQEIQYGTSITKEFAASIEKSGSSFFGAESQVKHFLASADYEEIKADLTEVLETNGEIADTDISNLLGDFKSLNQLLKNTGMSAGAAAKMIQSLIQGKLTVDQLSNAVLAAIANFDSLAGISSGIIDKMSNYDLGIDENQVTETLGSWSEVLMSNLKKGAYGNTQNFRILDFLFGTSWREGLEGAELRQEMERLALMVEQNAETMWHSWDDLAKGRNYKGEYGIDLDDLSISHNAQGGFDITGYETKTTSEIVDIIKNAYGVSREYAEMMVTDFKNNSLDMATALAENDYLAGIEAAKEELREFAGEKIIDESELKAIGDFYGKSIEDVRKALEISEDNVTHFWTDEGRIKKTKDLISELNNLKPNLAEQFREDKILNVTELQNALQDLRIPESAQAAIVEDFAKLAKDGSGKIKAILSDGTLKEIDVAAGQSIEQAIAQAEQDLQNDKLAEAIAGAFENIRAIKIKADIKGLANQIETYLSQTFTIKVEANIEGEKTTTIIPQQGSGDNTVTPQVNTKPIEGQMDEIFSSKTVDVNVSESSIAEGNAQIDAMVEPRTLVIAVDFDVVGTSGGIDAFFNYAHGGGTTAATGLVNSPREQDVLVSEEGPELIQTKNGYYLTGQNGPEMAHLEKGDTVYTAEETKKILGPHNHKVRTRLSGGGTIGGYDGSSFGGSGGGGSDDDDDEPWENSFDKLYNLVRQIEEENRQRERIERRYEQLLESIATNAKGLIEISREELAQLSAERQLQKDLINGRLEQIAEYEQEKGLTDYAWTEVNKYGEKILRVNWELIDAITDSDQGGEVEDYINQLEEWVDSINEAEDTLIDIEDTINDIKERGEDEYFDLEEKIKDAIVKAREEEIDQLGQINDSINDSASSVLDSLQKTLDRQRQLRENQESETELSDLRRQLAYLQQDTSGANDLRIKELQKEINDKSTDYTDQLIDQKIDELQDQNEKAAEQRQWQIELAQAQLDQYVNSGQIWNDVYKLMEDGLDKDSGLVRGSRLEELLRSSEGFEGMSQIGKMKWMEELTDLIAQSLGYLELGRQLEDLQGGEGIPKIGEGIVFYKDGKYYEGILQDDGSVKVGEEKYNNVYQGYDGRFYAGENYSEEEIRLNNEGEIIRPEKEKQEDFDEGGFGGYYGGTNNSPDLQGEINKNNQQIAENNLKRDQLNDERLAELAKVEASNLPGIDKQDLANAINSQYSKDMNALTNQNNNLQAQNAALYAQQLMGTYKTGGLADFTGPAWLDGTKSKPEYVLNSVQTKSFLTLVDILGSIKSGTFQGNAQNDKGDTFDIDINIETVREEVDIDMVAEKVQKSVVSASKYRNNIFAKR